jgi:hypothetical protein
LFTVKLNLCPDTNRKRWSPFIFGLESSRRRSLRKKAKGRVEAVLSQSGTGRYFGEEIIDELC